MRWREFQAWQGLARKRALQRMNDRNRDAARRDWYQKGGAAR